MKYKPLDKPWLNDDDTITMWEDGQYAGTHKVCLADLMRANPWFIKQYASIYGTTRLVPDKVWVLIQLLTKLPSGVLIEVGVFRGGFLKLLADTIPSRSIYAYDTFTGVPQEVLTPADPPQKPGWFSNVNLEMVKEFVGYDNRITYFPGVFPSSFHLTTITLPIAFVHIDVNNYQTTAAALDLFYTHVESGGIIVIDDYGAKYCSGVTKAVDKFVFSKPEPMYQFVDKQAIIIKRGPLCES